MAAEEYQRQIKAAKVWLQKNNSGRIPRGILPLLLKLN